jgi:hypothetical protein
MTPWRGDGRAAVPLVVAAAATLVHPAWWRWFVSGSVAAYALTPAAWAEIQAARRRDRASPIIGSGRHRDGRHADPTRDANR